MEREEEHFRVTLKQRAGKVWERMETGEMSRWVRVGWRVFTASGTKNLRRSPRVNGGKGKQGQVNAMKGNESGGST